MPLYTIIYNFILDFLFISSRLSCYVVVGVLANAPGTTEYLISLTSADSTTILALGIPVSGYVGPQSTDYYKISLVAPGQDLRISLTPFAGDPDMYVAMQPNRHPSASNYTWYSMSFGSDTLVIQSYDLEGYCVPNPSIGKVCDVFVSVKGFTNSSYTIVATADSSFLGAVSLIDGIPQSSWVDAHSYTYFKFTVSSLDEASGYLVGDIKFSLLSADTDQDLFVSFSGEPGKDHFDYASTHGQLETDEVVVNANMDHFCFGCTVYVAVYGYFAGHFSITASSKGVVSLQAGRVVTGHVDQSQILYYKFRNTDPAAVITISLMKVYGDPDLYVNTLNLDASAITFPSPYKYGTYLWSSRTSSGLDTIVIRYDDSSFCSNCEFIVGVYGYQNSSYSLAFSSSEDEVVQLRHDRPMRLSLRPSMLRYCAYIITGSSESVIVSLTSLDLGSADLFVRVVQLESMLGLNASRIFPDPLVPSSYTYSTGGSEDDIVAVSGPFENTTVVLITVRANTAVSFNILVASSKSVVVLEAGIPHNHFVSKGNMEYFRFYVEDSSESLQITCTARSGDPDLLASMNFHTPYCDMSMGLHCYNYTWRSYAYSTDQLIISSDNPCSPRTMYTQISPTCDPKTSYHAGYIYIAVSGYTDSKFIITISPAGAPISLLPGKPQKGLICIQMHIL